MSTAGISAPRTTATDSRSLPADRRRAPSTDHAAPADAPVDLRTLLRDALHSAPPPSAEAGLHAGYLLGTEIADLIAWQPAWNEAGTVVLGEIPTDAESEPALIVRYRSDLGPGHEVLEVAVPCPVQLGCGPAWQTVNGRDDLVDALDRRASSRWCDQHGPDEDPPSTPEEST